MSPRGDIRDIGAASAAVALLERGRWREALEVVDSQSSDAEALLVRGCSLFFTEPERAKDVLSKAVRLLPDGELRDKGTIWLASSYWAAGEGKEALAILETIDPSNDIIRFLVGLNTSIFESSKLRASLAALTAIADLVDTAADLYKAKFFFQRAWLKRRLDDRDGAISDYEAARYWFEKSDAPRYLAATTNNLAGLFLDTGRISEAHDAVDAALAALRNDPVYAAKMLDQKATIFLAEKKYEEAEKLAQRSVVLLVGTDSRLSLAESLITHAKALQFLTRYTQSLVALDQAREIASYLGNKQIFLQVTKAEKETAHLLAHKSHLEMVQTALDLSDDSLRGAARLIGVKAQPLDRFIRLHGIRRHPKVRKSIITKPRK